VTTEAESSVPNALRSRRCYVRAAFRRGGVGRELVLSLLARMQSNQVVAANAAPGNIPFSEAMASRTIRASENRIPSPDQVR
jgi:hypothetical protein